MTDIKAEAKAFFARDLIELVDIINGITHIGAASKEDLFRFPVLREHIFKTANDVIFLQERNEGRIKFDIKRKLVCSCELGETIATIKARMNNDVFHTAIAAKFDGFFGVFFKKHVRDNR